MVKPKRRSTEEEIESGNRYISISLPAKIVELIDTLVDNENVGTTRAGMMRNFIIKGLQEMMVLNGFINNIVNGRELKEIDLVLKTINFNYTNTLNLEVIMFLYRYMKLHKKPKGALRFLSTTFMQDILTVTTVSNFGKYIGLVKVSRVDPTPNQFFEYEALIKTDLEKRKVRINRSNAKYIKDENLLLYTPFELYFNKYDKLYYLKPKGEKIYCQNLIRA